MSTEDIPVRRRKKKKKRRASGCLIVLLVMFLLAAAAAFGIFVFYNNIAGYNDAYDPKDTEIRAFSVPKGATTAKIGELLAADGLIEDSRTFVLKTKFMELDGKYQAGDFALSPSMTMEEIMEQLQDAKKSVTSFTIPEGYTIRQIAAKLTEEGLIDSERDFYEACEKDYDYWFLDGLEDISLKDPTGTVSASANRLEGFLFPDTYEIFVGSDAEDIIEKMLSRFEQIFNGEMQDQLSRLSLNGEPMSVYQLVSLASLIEKETKTAEERPLVSSVIYNRLSIGMKLQFCSTVLYSLGEHKDRLLYSDLEVDSPYNTYMYEGLVPGPIASPGKACLQAALSPAETDYLYFVLKGDGSGTHNFAKNSSDFANYKEDYLNTLNQ